jgi:hypothetical protein
VRASKFAGDHRIHGMIGRSAPFVRANRPLTGIHGHGSSFFVYHGVIILNLKSQSEKRPGQRNTRWIYPSVPNFTTFKPNSESPIGSRSAKPGLTARSGLEPDLVPIRTRESTDARQTLVNPISSKPLSATASSILAFTHSA